MVGVLLATTSLGAEFSLDLIEGVLKQSSEAALNLTESALVTNPSNPELLILKGRALMGLKRNEEALDALNDALAANPKSGGAYASRSGVFGDLQRFTEGLRDAELGLKYARTPRERAIAAYNKGYNLQGLSRRHDALAAYGLAVQSDPTYSRGHFGKGKLLYQMRMWREALPVLNKALELNPRLGAAWAYKAETLFQLGEISVGMAAAEAAVKASPDDPRSYRARAIGHHRMNQLQPMLEDAERIIQLNPSYQTAHILKGIALEQLGRLREAMDEYLKDTDTVQAERYASRLVTETITPFQSAGRATNCGMVSAAPGEPARVVLPTDDSATMVRSIDSCFERALKSVFDEAQARSEAEQKRPIQPMRLGGPSRRSGISRNDRSSKR